MNRIVSTITSKWRVTLPEEVRKQISLKIGQRIAWEVEGDKLVGRRVRSVSELSGCLKAGRGPARGREARENFAKAAIARHERVSRRIP